ncbi:MAG: bifunctional (p)ppGpp synthetase/guanosine-3',5'-bis(diphosphate) 3'-pyrophosphohydrolase [Gammaproteobacteria bacterium]|nr:bifunctional (p)ppGpp synthetase/guanosine-3',5'-bis(diphosphate) 3'-pyrophosphohydrolase [Gammaproteobacteria bacterium]MDH5272409.1 bifunctional (p)ppGpp synthetase/guanosine-3',5'-bis(diphosphate) 3'-pyrophosphohydrolase [Gammaproteobacteria bacterium]
MKPAEIDIHSLAPKVRTALEAVSVLAPNEHTLRSVELMAALAQLQADDDVLLAALLIPLRQGRLIEEPRALELFGAAAVHMARELERVGDSGIPAEWNPGQHLRPEQAEGLRKLLLALASDVRLVLIRLALQLVRMRGMKSAPEAELRRAALETQEIYAPLANRLGIWQFKWELEDLAFRFSAPEDYKRIAGWLKSKRAERERHIEDAKRELSRELDQLRIRGEVTGRPKHIYSIWRKMQRKSLQFDQVMDALAVRVMVDTIAECYAALGIVHGLWQYIPGEFDDYIATPKGNNYRSLHTAVIGPGRLPLEVQIRTREMHEHAELGVAAHWQYKEGRKAETSFQQKMVWLRQLLEPSQREGAEPDLLAGLQAEVFEDRVFALSPRGEVVDLPKGATPLDFAYQVHTNLGHRCRGARVNGRMVTLDYKLSNGDTVEIIPSKQPHPSRDWLLPQLGFLASPRSRAKVRSWFRKQDEDQNREQGRQMLERELERLGVRAPPLPEILGDLGLASADALYLGLGEGDISLAQVAGAVHRRLHERQEVQRGPRLSRPAANGGSAGMVIDGVGDLLSTIARCCRPVPPEEILGYITIGRGVSIHRATCSNLLRLRQVNPERVLTVDWGRPSEERTFPVGIVIDAYDRRGLVRDISSVLADEHISIEAMKTVTDAAEGTASVDVTVKVHGLEELSRLLARFSSLPNVIRARRRH